MIEELKIKKQNFKKALKDKGIENIIIFKDEDIFYFTGFYGKDSGSILIYAGKDIYLLVHSIYYEDAKASIPDKEIILVKYEREPVKKIVEILKDLNIKNINTEGKNITYEFYEQIRNGLKKIDIKLEYIKALIEDIRMIKLDTEILKIKEVCNITDRTLDFIYGLNEKRLKDLSETKLSNEILTKFISLGADDKSFDLIVASGINSSKPHYMPSNKNIEEGVLLMDIGCRYKNYCSDITRTVFIGRNRDKRIEDIYKIVLKAQTLAIESCKEGALCSDIDKIARDYISSKGYGKNFIHGLGHGVGLEVHEKPRVAKGVDIVLKENMVITIEPGIYIEGYGGIRIEDMLAIKKDKCEVLFKSSKEMIVLN